jgi:plasmid stabilization system protein ParE
VFPRLGGRIEEDNPYDLREIVYRDYRVVYHYDGTTVFIVDVFHGRYPLRLGDVTFE